MENIDREILLNELVDGVRVKRVLGPNGPDDSEYEYQPYEKNGG